MQAGQNYYGAGYGQPPVPQPIPLDQSVDQAYGQFLRNNAQKVGPYQNTLAERWANNGRQYIINILSNYQNQGNALNTQGVYAQVRDWCVTVIQGLQQTGVVGAGRAPVQMGGAGYGAPVTGMQSGNAALSTINVNQQQLQQQVNATQAAPAQPVASAQTAPVAPPNAPPAPQQTKPIRNIYMHQEKEEVEVEAPFAEGAVRICSNAESKYGYKFMTAKVTRSWSNLFGLTVELLRFFGRNDFVADVTVPMHAYCAGVKVDDAKAFIDLLKDVVREYNEHGESFTDVIENIRSVAGMCTNDALKKVVFAIISRSIEKIVNAGIFGIPRILNGDYSLARIASKCPIKDFHSLVDCRVGMAGYTANKLENILNYQEIWSQIFRYSVIKPIENMEVLNPDNLKEISNVFRYVNLNGAESATRVPGFRVFEDVEANREQCLSVASNNAVIHIKNNPCVIYRVNGCDAIFNKDICYEFTDEPYASEFDYAFGRTLRNKKLDDGVVDILVIDGDAISRLGGLAVDPGKKFFFSKTK